MLKRAYSTLALKAVDRADGKRIFTGIASTPTTDRMSDIVEPKGAVFKLPLPLLWQHNHMQPVGWVTKAKITPAGIEIEGEIADLEEEGKLKDRLDEAWQSLKIGLVRGLSIGFDPIEHSQIDGTYGRRYTKWEWLELSAVTIAANAEATIHAIKSMDDQLRAASGLVEKRVFRLDEKPGASGKSTPVIPKPQEGKMTIQEQIKAFEAARAEKAKQMDAIMTASGTSGETLDAEKSAEYDQAAAEIEQIDKHLGRLRTHEKTMAAAAKPVTTVVTGDGNTVAASNSRGDGIIAVAKKLPPGVAFARYAGIMACAKGSTSDALMIAKNIFPEEKALHNIILHNARVSKAAVDIGTSTDTDFAAPLVQYRDMASEFIDFLRPQTIIGKIPNLRKVPFKIRVPRQTGGGSANWVGEASPKGVTAIALDNVTLDHKKLATIAVISEELARFSQPSAEMIIRDTLAGAIVQQMDTDFVNPANAGTANVKPASITNTSVAIPSVGNDETSVRLDVAAIFAPFIAANLSPINGVWIMSATNALALSLMVNSLGQPSFPGISMLGGTFFGMPVVVSESVSDVVILANASDILIADDGQVTIDTSREASVQMDSAPTDPPVAATVFISLWQQNLLGIRAERFVDWVKGRAAAVQYLSSVDWGQAAT